LHQGFITLVDKFYAAKQNSAAKDGDRQEDCSWIHIKPLKSLIWKKGIRENQLKSTKPRMNQ
jgi:hypothetical protein